jgi:hypothetical protein
MTLAVEQSADAPAAPRAADPRLSQAVLVISLAVIAVNVVVLFAGAWLTGVTIDEPIHNDRLENYFQTGWYLPDRQMTDGQPDLSISGLYVYGPVAALVAHVSAVLFGTEGWNEVSWTGEAYAARHIAIALFSVLGIVAVGAIVRLLTRSWRWAALGAAMISAIPTYTGHGMFNIKDAPVAAGYTVVTLGVVALSRPNVVDRRLKLLGIGALALGAVVLVGTRPGTWVAVGASVAAMLGLTLVVDWARSGRSWALRRLRVRFGLALLGVAIAYLVLLVIYPNVFGSPLHLYEAVKDSADYPWDDIILTAGQYLSMPPPWYYLPLWWIAQTPAVILVLAWVGLLWPVVLLLRRRSAQAGDADRAVGIGLVAVQALTLPLIGIATTAVFYDATRQVLFVLPAWAASAGVAAWLLARRWQSSPRRWLRPGLQATVAAGIVVPTLSALTLFPYSYSWFNAPTTLFPINTNWMTDYWWASDREVTPMLPLEEPHACYPWKPSVQLLSCYIEPQMWPYWDTRGQAATAAPLAPGEYFRVAFNRGGNAIADQGCEIENIVERRLLWQKLTMSYVERCVVPLETYPELTGIRARAGGGALPYLLWGWYRTPEPAYTWAWDEKAEVGFLLPDAWEGRDVRLTVDAAPYIPEGQTGSSLDLYVNGSQVGHYEFADDGLRTLTASVPADVLASVGDGRVVVRIAAPFASVPTEPGSTGQARSLRLQSLVIEPEG